MTLTAKWYHNAAKNQLSGKTDWEGDDIKVSLLNDGYSPDPEDHATFDHCRHHEVDGEGYTPQPLEGKRLHVEEAGLLALKADDVTWGPGVTLTARYAIIYKDPDELLGFVDFGSDQSCTSGTFILKWTPSVLRVVIM